MENSIFGVVEIKYIDETNSEFYKKGDFPALKTFIEDENGNMTEKDHGVIILRRLFPFDEPETMITVLDENEEEIGIIKDINALKEKEMLKNELEKTYFMPVIKKIVSMKEKFGYANFDVKTDRGRLSFSLTEIYKSMIKIGKRIIITDFDGNRYEIKDYEALDRRSFGFIELYI